MIKKFILVVEDDATICCVVGELLNLEGFEFQSVNDGRQALDFLTQGSPVPDAILLDLMMPVCSGYEFLNLLKSYPKFKNIPVIITSAAANAQETAQLHGVELVRKPLDAEELLKKLQKVIV